MSLSDELRQSVGPIWEKTVTHPFVIELGDGTLPEEKFSVYFQQDSLFVKDLVALMCGGIVKAPDFASSSLLAARVHGALDDEDGLFERFFRDTGLSPDQVRDIKHLPTSFAYSSFLRGIAREGTFHEIITAFLGVEWPYLEWGKRLAAQGKRPANKYYQTWIDVHAAKELEDFVDWMRSVLDNATVGHTNRLKEIFLTVLRYEYLFWEMAYTGERWPE
jgi:thiaminase/transcriptional activator TenA